MISSIDGIADDLDNYIFFAQEFESDNIFIYTLSLDI